MLYLATKASMQAFDAIWYAIKVEYGSFEDMFHPHHLLHMPLVWVLRRVLSLLLIEVRAIDIAQILSALAGAGAVVFFRRILSGLGRPEFFSYAGAIIYGSSGALWHEATDGEPYAIAVFFSAAAIYFGLFGDTRAARLLGGFLAGLAICFHQESVVLVLVPIFVWLISNREARLNLKTGIFAGTAAAVALAVQFGAFIALKPMDLRSLGRWIFHYPIWMSSYLEFSNAPMRDSLRGLTMNVVFSKLSFFPARYLLYFLMVILAYIVYCWISRRGRLENQPLFALFLASFLGGAFAFWWDPYNHKFWMFPFFSALLLSLSVLRVPAPRAVLSCLAAILLLSNLGLRFIWRAVDECNVYQASLASVSEMEKGAWIVFATVDERLQAQMIYFGGYHRTANPVQFGLSSSPKQTESAIRRGDPIYMFLSRNDLNQKIKSYFDGRMPQKERAFWERFKIELSPEFPLPDGRHGFHRLRLRDGDQPSDSP
ncbi:MAG: DUF2723 domain-containing protein [Candidatus Coatesbacteria bacterium]|nr:DUF2723 domain-containing protein [Candidatus Coatesbacteria bacterium]